jgi:hypothetical protein
MSLQVLASNLAARGRHGDSMLVHMSPAEVQGLHSLAVAHTGEGLTINPHTGLPEAFKLGNFLPAIAGAALSFIPGVGPLMAAGIVGGLTGLATGSLEKGLTAGLGAYGGAGIASGLGAAGATQTAGATGGVSPMAASASSPAAASAAYGDSSAAGYAALDDSAAASLPQAMGSGATQASMAAASPSAFTRNMAQAGQGAQSMGSQTARDAFVKKMGGPLGLMQAGNLAFTPALAKHEDNSGNVDYDPGDIRPYTYDPRTQQYHALPSYKATKHMALGGSVQDLIDQASSQSRGVPVQAVHPADTGVPPGGFDFNDINRDLGPNAPHLYSYDAAHQRFGRMIPAPVMPSNVDQFGDRNFGGAGSSGVGDGSGISSGQNADGSPSTGVSTSGPPGLSGIANAIGVAVGAVANAMSAPNDAPAAVESMGTAAGPSAANGVSSGVSGGNDGGPAGAADSPGAPGGDAPGDGPGAASDSGNGNGTGVGGNSGGTSGGDSDSGSYALGGLAALAGGGNSVTPQPPRFLRGPGDGVSDSIPAQINGQRPAALADGEFVVPARIVSEIGNGSSEAGARQLYAMMDRIQKRRAKTTGSGNVAVDSRARALLPA